MVLVQRESRVQLKDSSGSRKQRASQWCNGWLMWSRRLWGYLLLIICSSHPYPAATCLKENRAPSSGSFPALLGLSSLRTSSGTKISVHKSLGDKNTELVVFSGGTAWNSLAKALSCDAIRCAYILPVSDGELYAQLHHLMSI